MLSPSGGARTEEIITPGHPSHTSVCKNLEGGWASLLRMVGACLPGPPNTLSRGG